MSDLEKTKFTGMRSENEGDRSGEFKDARSTLVGNINTLLTELAAMRDAGESMPNGMTILDRPRIIRTILGRTAARTSTMIEEKSGGVSMFGDNVTSRLQLQVVLPTDGGKGIKVLEATGSDPLERSIYGDEYPGHGRDNINVSFRVTEDFVGRDSSYFGYEVGGNGAVRRRFVDHRGYNISQAVRSEEDLQLAANAFEQFRTELF